MAEPFQPLTELATTPISVPGTDVPASIPGALLPQSQSPEAVKAEIGLRNVAEGSEITGMQQFLATAAALSGNFGPAIALQEQKRRAQMTMQLFPVMNSVGKLITSGKHDEAAEAITNALSVAEAKAPGLVTPLQAMLSDVNQKRQAWSDLNTLTTVALKNMPKDHPDRQQWEALAEANKNRSAMSASMVKEILPLLRPHIQTIEGATRVTGQLSGETMSRPLETTFDDKVLSGNTGLFLAQMVPGLTPELASGLLRGYPINLKDVGVVQPTEENKANLRQLITMAQDKAAQLVIGQGVPLDPAVALERQAAGASPFAVATRTGTPEQMQAAREGWYQRAIRLAQAPVDAKMNDRGYPASVGVVGLSLDPDRPENFGQRMEGLSFNDMAASNGKVVPFNSQILNEKVQPAISAYTGLNKVVKLWEVFGDPTSIWDTVEIGLTRRVSDLLGVPLSENVTVGKALQLVVSQAIDDVEATRAISSSEAKQLKDFTIRGFASSEGAQRAVGELQDRLKDKLSLYIERNKIDNATVLQKAKAVTPQAKNIPDEQLYRSFNVTPALASALLSNEGSKQGDVSFMGAASRWQIMPDTARPYLEQLGYNVKNMTNEAIGSLLNSSERIADTVGLTHIATLESKYPGRPDLVMAEYHGGAGAVLPDGTVNPKSKEPDRPGKPGLYTTEYVKRGMTKFGLEKGTGKVIPVRQRKDLRLSETP